MAKCTQQQPGKWVSDWQTTDPTPGWNTGCVLMLREPEGLFAVREVRVISMALSPSPGSGNIPNLQFGAFVTIGNAPEPWTVSPCSFPQGYNNTCITFLTTHRVTWMKASAASPIWEHTQTQGHHPPPTALVGDVPQVSLPDVMGPPRAHKALWCGKCTPHHHSPLSHFWGTPLPCSWHKGRATSRCEGLFEVHDSIKSKILKGTISMQGSSFMGDVGSYHLSSLVPFFSLLILPQTHPPTTPLPQKRTKFHTHMQQKFRALWRRCFDSVVHFPFCKFLLSPAWESDIWTEKDPHPQT